MINSRDKIPYIFENEKYLYWRNWDKLKYIVTDADGNDRRNEFRKFFNLKKSLYPEILIVH